MLKTRRTVLRLAASTGMCLAGAASFAQPGNGTDDFILGMSAPMSGTAGAYGLQMRQGIEACFAAVNQAGGVKGRKLRLVALDDGYEPAAAVANTKRLIDREHAFALMAFYGTASSEAVLPVLNERGIPLIGTISGAESLRTPSTGQIFHLRASYGDETAAIIKNLTAVGLQRIAVVYQDDGFGRAGLQGVKNALAAFNLQPVATATVVRNSVDVAAAVATIAPASAQAVIMVALHKPSAAFIEQMRAAGASPFFVGLSPIGTDQLVAALGASNSRGIQVAQVIPNPWSGKTEVAREYKKALAAFDKKAELSYYGLEGYINAKLVIAGLQRLGDQPTPAKLAAALRSAPFNIGGYRVSFSGTGNQGSSYVEISVIGRDGHILN
jgi:branched-chain amino acid transport system substrate-binding protein